MIATLWKVMVRMKEATYKSILLTAWHLVGHPNSRARIIIVRTCNNHSFFGNVLVHLNGELYSQMSQQIIDSLIKTLHSLLLSKSMKTFVIPLNRKILEVYKNLAST